MALPLCSLGLTDCSHRPRLWLSRGGSPKGHALTGALGLATPCPERRRGSGVSVWSCRAAEWPAARSLRPTTNHPRGLGHCAAAGYPVLLRHPLALSPFLPTHSLAPSQPLPLPHRNGVWRDGTSAHGRRLCQWQFDCQGTTSVDQCSGSLLAPSREALVGIMSLPQCRPGPPFQRHESHLQRSSLPQRCDCRIPGSSTFSDSTRLVYAILKCRPDEVAADSSPAPRHGELWCDGRNCDPRFRQAGMDCCLQRALTWPIALRLLFLLL